jgi:hypothetical protein
MAASDRFDGRRLKALTGDPSKFKQYIDTKFEKLDVSKSGSLSAEELKPAVAEWGSLLGLPPMGSSSETDQVNERTLQMNQVSNKYTLHCPYIPSKIPSTVFLQNSCVCRSGSITISGG